MRSHKQSKTATMQLRKTATRKFKRHPVDRMPNRKSSGAILADLKHRLSEIYDLNAAGSVLTWDQATYMHRGVGSWRCCDALRMSVSPILRSED